MTDNAKAPADSDSDGPKIVGKVVALLIALGGGASVPEIAGFQIDSPAPVRASLIGVGALAWALAVLLARRRKSESSGAFLHRLLWLIITLFASLAIVSVAYLTLLPRYTQPFDGNRIIVGTELTELGHRYHDGQPNATDERILFDFHGDASKAWTAASIAPRRISLLALLYPLVALAVTAVVVAEESIGPPGR